MARDGSGNWIPLAPVVGGTVITSTWANNMMTSFGADITESLDRNGRGGMLVPFRIADGTKSEPGYSWTAELSTGLYRDLGGSDMRVSITGTDIFRWNGSGAQISFDDGASWQAVLTDGGGAGLTPVAPGTGEGQTLYWDQLTDQQWEPTNVMLVDNAAGKAGIGVLGLTLEADFTVFQSGSLRGWSAGPATVVLAERSADVALTLAGGNINAGRLNFGDTDSETAGQVVYDHSAMEMSFNIEGATILAADAAGIDVTGDIVSSGDLGIGGVPSVPLDVLSTPISPVWSPSSSTVAIINATANAALSIVTNSGGQCRLNFGDVEEELQGQIRYDHSNDNMLFRTSAATRMKISGTGVVSGVWNDFGTNNNNAQFQKLTQAQYDGITPDADTIYFIVG